MRKSEKILIRKTNYNNDLCKNSKTMIFFHCKCTYVYVTVKNGGENMPSKSGRNFRGQLVPGAGFAQQTHLWKGHQPVANRSPKLCGGLWGWVSAG
jgi:hypothetical protein